ncbi:hypothetical protein ACIOMM_08515 [Streptomyces sp. NPDC087908]|uniref:hypothetical protein n=1 Tax=Streptomyces sp. NPDC087908 TaxID=3365820 RepID=UPI00381B3017
MNSLLGEFTKKLGDRWASLLALPGLLWLAVASAAVTAGHCHAFDVGRLRDRLTAFVEDPAHRAAGTALLLIAAVLLGSAMVGQTMSAGGRFVVWWWDRSGTGWLSGARARRHRRWAAHVAIVDAPSATAAEIAEHTMLADRICVIEPDRPFWIGDRIRAIHVRTIRLYHLDLTTTWPRLWLVLPETTQTALTRASEAWASAARLYAWAVLYALLFVVWYPALLVAAAIAVTAQLRARQATRDLADLTEAAVDVHYRELLELLGRAPGTGLDPGHGPELTGWFRRTRWDPASPLHE